MTMPIVNLMVDSGPTLLYGADVHVTLESHMSFMRAHPSTSMLQLDPRDAYKYEADLNGLLEHLKVPLELHWIIMRLNDYTSPYEFQSDTEALMIPPESVVKSIKQLLNTTQARLA